jgi:MoaA/NifB/PqqE/SkfB family radical SAM enzyme
MTITIKLFLKRAVKAVLPYGILVVYRYLKNRSCQKKPLRKKYQLPTSVSIEASTLCQLNCKSCYMRKNNSGTMGKGYLKFSDFKKFLYNHKFIKNIDLSNSGEIFLNPDLIHIVKYAFENGIGLTANGGVNFNTVSDEVIEALVKYNFKSMTISIDGASKEIYSTYRINGDFDTVIDNIKKLNLMKQKHGSKFPKLTWQYILMEHNENDVIKAKRMAEELNMSIRFKRTWDKGYIPKNVEMLKKETNLKYLTREDEITKEKRPYAAGSLCYQLWNSPQINWDGRLLGCCCVFNDDFGVNVFKIGLKRAVNSKRYKYAKKMIQGKVNPPKSIKNIPCCNCPNYKIMRETGSYLEEPIQNFIIR